MKDVVSSVSGFNIYINRYGEAIYYNIFDKNGYIVSREVEKKFKLFQNRYSIICIVLILLGDYFKTWQNTLLVGIGAAIIVEVYFRLFYLKKLKVIKNFKRERKVTLLEAIIKSKEKEKTIMKACAYILLSILIFINAIQQNYDAIFLVLSAVVSVYSIYLAIINIIAFSKMRK